MPRASGTSGACWSGSEGRGGRRHWATLALCAAAGADSGWPRAGRRSAHPPRPCVTALWRFRYASSAPARPAPVPRHRDRPDGSRHHRCGCGPRSGAESLGGHAEPPVPRRRDRSPAYRLPRDAAGERLDRRPVPRLRPHRPARALELRRHLGAGPREPPDYARPLPATFPGTAGPGPRAPTARSYGGRWSGSMPRPRKASPPTFHEFAVRGSCCGPRAGSGTRTGRRWRPPTPPQCGRRAAGSSNRRPTPAPPPASRGGSSPSIGRSCSSAPVPWER